MGFKCLNGKAYLIFGINGKIDLRSGLPSTQKKNLLPQPLLEQFSRFNHYAAENVGGQGAAPGDVMAFNVKTGKLIWSFHTIPHLGEVGADT